MSGFTLNEIVEAVAAQLEPLIASGVDIQSHPLEVSGTSITVMPDAGSFITYFDTYSEDGIATVRLRLRIVSGGEDLQESAYRRLYDLLSVGTGNSRSVLDALGAADSSGVRWTLGLAGCAVRPVDVDMSPDEASADLLIEVIINKDGAVA